MKNNYEIGSCGEKLVDKLTDNLDRRSVSRRRASSAPRIVVFPPMEETNNAGRGRESRQFSRREEGSLKSSSSSDSESGELRSETCSASDSSSDGGERAGRHRSSVSIRKLFERLALRIRSRSSSPVERRPGKQPAPPKRLLRPPVSYTYVRGMSGLPTQRVPRHVAYQYVT